VRRITFGGGDLVDFHPLAPDQFLYLLLPPPGRDALTIDASFTWTGYEQMAEADRPVGAYYTVRAWRPEVAELAYVWGGAESKTLTAIRKHLRQQVGLPRDAVSLLGYWRRGELTADELSD